MTTKITAGYKKLKCAMATLGIDNIGDGNGVSFDIPIGGTVEQIIVNTTTAFDSGTSDKITITDGATVYASAASVHAKGVVTVSNLGKFYPNGGAITMSIESEGAAAAAGVADVVVVWDTVNRPDAP